MGAGRLDRKIDIERKTVTEDEFGEEIETWEILSARRSARVTPISGDERFTSDQFVSKLQVEFRIRYSSLVSGLNPLDRIVYPAADGSPDAHEVYDIMAVDEIVRGKWLSVKAARRSEIQNA